MTPEKLLQPRYKVIADIKSGMYSVCDQGFIINNKTGKPIMPYLNANPKDKKKKPYVYVKLQDGDRQRSFHVGVLVGKAFVDNPEEKPCINHDDGDKLNNHYSNIKWATHKENSQHAVSIGLTKSGSKRSGAKLNDADVVNIRKMFKEGRQIFEIACDFRVSTSLISKVVNNKSYKNVTT